MSQGNKERYSEIIVTVTFAYCSHHFFVIKEVVRQLPKKLFLLAMKQIEVRVLF